MRAYQFQTAAVKVAMSTARNTGAVGQKAIVPRVIRQLFTDKRITLLDFGCGAAQAHTKALQADGYQCTGYDFSIGNTAALLKRYDVVFASNVLNVQADTEMLQATLAQIKGSMHSHSAAVVNYPGSPRYVGISNKEMESQLCQAFSYVERLPIKGHWVWLCRK